MRVDEELNQGGRNEMETVELQRLSESQSQVKRYMSLGTLESLNWETKCWRGQEVSKKSEFGLGSTCSTGFDIHIKAEA